MAKLLQTTITGSGETSLLVSGSSILMPSMSGSVDSGSAAQMYIDIAPRNRGLKLHLTQAGSYGSTNSPYTCIGAWSSGPNKINSVQNIANASSGKSKNDVIVAGGYIAPGATNKSETYDGSSWSDGGNLITSRWTSVVGTSNAALAMGGATPTRVSCTEEYNGTSFASTTAMINSHADGNITGNENAAIYVAGYVGGSSLGTQTEIWTGDIWTAGTAAPTNQLLGQGVGNATNALIIPGNTTPSSPAYGATTCVSYFDGLTFSQNANLTFCHGGGASIGNTNADHAVVTGGCTLGTPAASANATEEWNGNVWTMGTNHPDGGTYLTGAGNVNSGIVMGGASPYAKTNEFTKVFIPPYTYTTKVSTDSWSGGGLMITARENPSGAGTTNAGLVFGGRTPTLQSATEEYNGTSWSAGGALAIARYAFNGSAGTQDAALAFGGSIAPSPVMQSATEEYNGTSWSPGGAMILARFDHGGAGTQNAAIAAGGRTSGPISVSNAETYDGSSWSSVNSMISANGGLTYGGTINSGLIIGGYNGSSYNCNAEDWNGTSWASSTAYPHVSFQGNMMGASSTDQLAYGGYAPGGAKQTAYKWDGTSWNVYPNLPSAVWGSAYGGSSSNAFAAAGLSPAIRNVMQVFTSATPTCSTTQFCLATWSGGAMTINSFCSSGGAGTAAAAIAFGGGGPNNPSNEKTNKYDGTTWSAANSMIAGRVCVGGTGTANAGLAIGGNISAAITQCTEEFDGTNWTVGGNLITQRVYPGTAGTQNAGLMFGGEANNVGTTCTEEYNGTSWSTGNVLIAASAFMAGTGTQNAALKMGGGHGGSSSTTEEYDGTTWRAGGTMNEARYMLAGAGSLNDAWALGGYNTKKNVENYNGLSWTVWKNLPLGTDINAGTGGSSSTANGTGLMSIGGNAVPYSTQIFENAAYNLGAWSGGPNIITARGRTTGAGTQNAGLLVGGYNNSGTVMYGCVEEFDGSSWAEGGALIISRAANAAVGTQNAALTANGFGASPFANLNSSETYDGSTWTAGPNTINTKGDTGGFGTQNAANVVGGYISPTGVTNTNEHYNGTSWAAGNTLITARSNPGVSGESCASAVVAGGSTPSQVACTEEYNGSTFSAGGALNFVRTEGENSQGGSANSALTFGGIKSPTNIACTEEYDGTSWSIRSPLSYTRYGIGGAGTVNAALAAGGMNPAAVGLTELWTKDNPVNQGIYCSIKSL